MFQSRTSGQQKQAQKSGPTLEEHMAACLEHLLGSSSDKHDLLTAKALLDDIKRKMLGTHVSGVIYGKYVDQYNERVKAYEAARTSGLVQPAGGPTKMKTKRIDLPVAEAKRNPTVIVPKSPPGA